MRSFLSSLILTCAGFATPAVAQQVDPCTVGTWLADTNDLADILALQMNGSAQPVGGAVRMDIFPTGTFKISVLDLAILVEVPNVPAMTVSVNGYSSGTIDIISDAWIVQVPDYNLTGSADVLGQRMTIPFSSASGMFGGGLGWYSCSGNSLRLETDPAQPMRMVRDWRRG